MSTNPCNDQPPWPQLSDEAAVTALEFMHHFVESFESQYFGEIHRYHEERSEANIQTVAPLTTDDPPF
ncbi:hypothetical protein HMI48_10850 [Acidithiobacillus ferrooxidans]|uniref:hypothetical protein n=1 Tax=Acidithiobacillus ferrooxidans TaxID=920 RepID=UPI001C070E6F|nr:hypothetical protein [Acidithiobacillus ferrooxidans]MBU2774348.1 hypothetical protein [Acidithiobacillus ferrooxidans]